MTSSLSRAPRPYSPHTHPSPYMLVPHPAMTFWFAQVSSKIDPYIRFTRAWLSYAPPTYLRRLLLPFRRVGRRLFRRFRPQRSISTTPIRIEIFVSKVMFQLEPIRWQTFVVQSMLPTFSNRILPIRLRIERTSTFLFRLYLKYPKLIFAEEKGLSPLFRPDTVERSPPAGSTPKEFSLSKKHFFQKKSKLLTHSKTSCESFKFTVSAVNFGFLFRSSS